MEALDAEFPEPDIHPSDAVCKFLSQLLEEFGDEWLNKYMFHYRWAREVDQDVVSKRLASEMMGVSLEEAAPFAAAIKERMSGRGFAVGSNPKTQDLIEEWFQQGLGLFEAHLKDRPFLFGARPSFAGEMRREPFALFDAKYYIYDIVCLCVYSFFSIKIKGDFVSNLHVLFT